MLVLVHAGQPGACKSTSMRLLLVEDEPRMAHFIARGLREQSYAVDIAADGEHAVYQARENEYDLLILDVMLPVKDGYAICRELRAAGLRYPILMLTARDAVDDRVAGLDAGADDYLTKPFDFKELLARIRALLRRPREIRPEVMRAGDLELNTGSHTVSRAGRSISLTAKEYALLEFLMLRRNRIVNREQIAQHVWDENFDPLTNIIDVYVRRLRAKLDSGSARPLIHTRRGEGYLFASDIVSDTEASGD
jgi:two-component system copper resistance phosphate regulon response regulator CusR